MGQEFSLEDFQVVNSGEEFTNEACVEHILREISRRIKQDNSGISGYLAYTRHRTRCGAPTVNRRSYGDEELRKFEVENDGFPLAATEDEIRVFDMSFLAGKHRKQKKKNQRSRSLTEVASLAGIRLPVITRPKFVDKLITGATSLTRKSSLKDKRYKRQLSDQTQFYVDSPADPPPPGYSTAEQSQAHPEGSCETTASSDHLLLCYHCGQQVLILDDLNSEPYESGGRNISCSACGREKSDRLCLRSSDDTSNDRLDDVGDERLKDSTEEEIVDIVADTCKRAGDKSEIQGDRSERHGDRSERHGDRFERPHDKPERECDKLEDVDDKDKKFGDKLKGVDDKAEKFGDKLKEDGVGDQYNGEDNFDKSQIVKDISERVVNSPQGVSFHYKKADEYKSVGKTLERVDVEYERTDAKTLEGLDIEYKKADGKTLERVDAEYERADYKYNKADNCLEKTCNSLGEQACRTSVYGQNEPEFTNESSQEHKLKPTASDSKSSFDSHEELVASISPHKCQQNLLNNTRVEDGSLCETHERLDNTLPQPDCQIDSLPNASVEKSETKSQDTGIRLRPHGSSSCFRGHVKRHCEAFSKFGQPDQTITYRKLAPCFKSDIHSTGSPAFLKNQNLHKGYQNLHTEGAKRWQKNYMNHHARDKTFPQAVMAKGFVKALADQINQQGALRHVIEGEGSEEANEMSASVLSINDCRAGEMHTSQIHVVEEESKQLQQFQDDETAGQIPESLTENSLSVNGSDSSPLSLKTHDQPGCCSTSDEVSQCLEEENTQFPENGEINNCEPPGASVSSSPAQNLCNIHKQQSVKSSSNSSPINSPGQNAQTSPSSDNQTLPPHSRQKPAVDYSSKPRTHKYSTSRKALVNNHKTSSIPSPSSPSLSPLTVSKTEPHWPSPESMTISSSESAHPTEFPQLEHSSCSCKNGASSQVSINASHSQCQCSHSHPPNSLNNSCHTSSNSHASPDHNVSTSFSECMDTPPPSQAGGDPDPSYRLNGYEGVALRAVSKRSSEQYRDSVFNTIYDNAPPISAAELFDSSWSDSDSFNDFSDDDDDDDGDNPNNNYRRKSKLSSKEQAESKIPDQPEACLRGRRFWIVEELLNTERDYVARLHLLHHVFYFRLDKENRHQTFLPSDTLKIMFSNTKSIFLFHHDFLLPQLEDRIKSWETVPRIGDLMKKNAPFLKMYTEYIRNFDRAMKLINQWMEKSAKFSEIIQDIQKLPECRNLSLQHHMLGPIQRVPRYELLLKDYVKHLPEGSPDYDDAKDALDLVTKAACHSNEAMKKIETFHKLLDIYQSLRGVPVDFISPTREFVTQGPVTKIAARSGERQPRQIFLFNDLVLICTQYNLLGTYSVRSLLEVESMEVKAGTNFHIPNTFVVHSKQKVVELLDENSTGEPFLWQEKIQSVIAKYKERKRSIKPDEPRELSSDISVPESCLGKTAPVWMQDDKATMCMLCNLSFNVVRRRHHCRACGKLICKTCCKKAPLEYMNGKTDRVCAICYNVIVNKHCMTSSSESSSAGRTSPKKKGILHVKASEPGVNSGYLQCSEDGGHSWNMYWITAHKDFVLYFFKAHEDVSAMSSLPLPGHEVNQVWDIEGRPHVFCLSHKKKKVYWFQTDNEKHLKRWIFVLEKLVQAELPDESSRLSSQSSSSNGSSASDGGGNINGNNRSSTHSGSQADSGYPGDSNNSLAALAVDQNDQENADGISQYDNVDGVVSE